MSRVIVVTRQLKSHEATISIVIKAVAELANSADDVDRYLEAMASNHIEEFTKKFIEFRDATWKTQLIDLTEL